MIESQAITGLILAGGRGARMGGIDKGLQHLNGQPLVAHAIARLQPQVGTLLINANRHTQDYAVFGYPVLPDGLPDFAGPLAGFLSGFAHCQTPYLLTVPCDSPLFPLNLASRLAAALEGAHADIAMVHAPEPNASGGTTLRPQPVFCLMKRELYDSLLRFTAAGGAKIDRWTAQHTTVLVPFDQAGDDPRAFFNANTLADLQQLETSHVRAAT